MHYFAECFWYGKVSWFRVHITYVVDYDSIIQRAKFNLKTKLEWLRVVILKFDFAEFREYYTAAVLLQVVLSGDAKNRAKKVSLILL